MYYLVYLFSTESWLRSTTTTKRETRKKWCRRRIREEKRHNRHTHKYTKKYRKIAEETALAWTRGRRYALKMEIFMLKRLHAAISTSVTRFCSIHSYVHVYRYTITHRWYTERQKHREKTSVKAGRHCWSHTRTHICNTCSHVHRGTHRVHIRGKFF